ESRLDAPALLGGDAPEEVCRVGVEPAGEPFHRLGRGVRLAPLDLADVLLREPTVGELALGQPGGDAERPETLADFTHRAAPRRLCDGNPFLHALIAGEAQLIAECFTCLLDNLSHGFYSRATSTVRRRNDRMVTRESLIRESPGGRSRGSR